MMDHCSSPAFLACSGAPPSSSTPAPPQGTSTLVQLRCVLSRCTTPSLPPLCCCFARILWRTDRFRSFALSLFALGSDLPVGADVHAHIAHHLPLQHSPSIFPRVLP